MHTAKVDLKSQLLSRHWAYFFLGGGEEGGKGGLFSDTIRTIDKKILPRLLVG